jgi:predicted AAA+ superfamily ATPase
MVSPLSERAYLPRLADAMLSSQLHAMGAVVIVGLKGCGKTATARQRAASEVLLDSDPNAARRAELDPRLVLDGDTPRLLDEWQRTPQLWDAVRRSVDDRGLPGQFILTGSATPRDDIPRHSGAGRFGTVRMRTMTLSEKQVTTPTVSVSDLLRGGAPAPANCPLTVREYLHHITVGGWPALVGANEATARTFLDGYLDIIIAHDIDEVSGATRNPRLVRRFLHAYAQMVSQPATVTAIIKRARDDAEDESTAPSRYAANPYLDALRRMMIVDEIPAWDPSVRSSKRLISAPKRHLGDPSLGASLLQMSPERMLNDLETTGFLFESLVAHDLRIYAEASGASCFHYREAEGRLEVDYILETRDGDWVGVEVKLGQVEIDKAATSLTKLADRVPRPPKSLVIVTGTSLAYTREDGIHVVPLGTLGP